MLLLYRVCKLSPQLSNWKCLLAVVLAATNSGCTDREVRQWHGDTMGSTYSVKVVPNGQIDEARFRARIDALLKRMDAVFSTWREDSEISLLNRLPVGRAQTVSADLYQVLLASKVLYERTDGGFDVTVAPALRIWGFGPHAPDSANDRLPSAGEIAAARSNIGFSAVHLLAARQVLKESPRELDLSAIAPGYVADRLAAWLEAEGQANYLVDISGELRASGRNEAGEPWRIGVERPDRATFGDIEGVVALSNQAIATSGDYRNYRQRHGHTYSHIFDARTASPVTHSLASVTVIAHSAMWADGWATALNVLGPDAGFALAVRERLPALFIVHVGGIRGSEDLNATVANGADRFVVRMTPAMTAVLTSSD